MKKFFSFFIFLLISVSASAQSNKLDAKLNKIYDKIDNGKLKDATKDLEELMEENPEYGKGWDLLGKIRLKEYKDAEKFNNLKITSNIKDKDGNPVENDSLGNALVKMLESFSPSKIAYDKYIYTLRKATYSTDDAYQASSLLRNYFVDVEIDTAVSKKALKYFNQAEEEFAAKNYETAAKTYKRALEEQPNFYKASLYMGDCFFFTGNYASAIASFKDAVEKFPFLLEPRKYLIDSYAKEKLYDKVVEECINAMCVYPDQSVAVKMEDALYYSNKKLSIQWTPRGVFPCKIEASSESSGVNKYKPEKEEKIKAPWTYYAEAKETIKANCNADGIIIKPSPLTTAKYLEVYAWEHMLKNSNDPWLEQARKMQKDGYLDCYVLVSCFHYDIYGQYKDFAAKNKSRITEYYKKYISARG